VKPHVCKKACPFVSKCKTCQERAAEANRSEMNRSQMNENLDEDDMMNSDLE
jgi:hypothetical protein